MPDHPGGPSPLEASRSIRTRSPGGRASRTVTACPQPMAVTQPGGPGCRSPGRTTRAWPVPGTSADGYSACPGGAPVKVECSVRPPAPITAEAPRCGSPSYGLGGAGPGGPRQVATSAVPGQAWVISNQHCVWPPPLPGAAAARPPATQHRQQAARQRHRRLDVARSAVAAHTASMHPGCAHRQPGCGNQAQLAGAAGQPALGSLGVRPATNPGSCGRTTGKSLACGSPTTHSARRESTA